MPTPFMYVDVHAWVTRILGDSEKRWSLEDRRFQTDTFIVSTPKWEPFAISEERWRETSVEGDSALAFDLRRWASQALDR